MIRNSLSFPQFRKYKNNAAYFRFDGPEAFEEVRRIGKKWIAEKYRAKILPDHHLVHDLLYDYADFAEAISETEYEAARKLVIS